MHFVSADDWFVYYSFINQAKEGNFLLADLFSSVEHVSIFRPLWLLVGLVAKVLMISAPVALHLFRIMLIPIFFSVSMFFTAYLFRDPLKRKFTLAFIAFSSGLGISLIHRLAKYPANYVDPYFSWPMDLWVPDINTFLTLFTSPHFIAATILLLIIFLLTVLFTTNYKYSYALYAGLAGAALFSFHPFQILKTFIIIGFFFLGLVIIKRKIIWPLIWYYLIFLVVSSPPIFYYIWLLQNDFLTTLRAAQNINPTTPLYLTIIAFGGLLFFAVVGIYFLIKYKKYTESKYLFLIIWIVIQFLLLYAPINYQRRLGLGIHFPLVTLTIISFYYIKQLKFQFIKKHFVTVVVLGFFIFIPSTLFALAAEGMVFNQARGFSYIDKSTYQAFLWFKNESPRDSIVFSDFKTGNILPAYALRTSYVGHPVETPYYRQRKKEPAWFFNKNRDEEIEKNFLRRRNVDYIFYGEIERQIGDYEPSKKLYLKERFSNSTVKIFEVL
ncbi:hypothetical protein CL633_00075 [bacterium]|nr:hypothetical protein [bacterium]